MNGGTISTADGTCTSPTGVVTGSGQFGGTVDNAGTLTPTSLTFADGLSNVATLRGTTFAGTITGAMHNTEFGQIRSNAGESLRVLDAAVVNRGRIEALGNATSQATLRFTAGMNNIGCPGLITGRNAELDFGAGLINAGSLALTASFNDLFGDITNTPTGTISVTGVLNLAGTLDVRFIDGYLPTGGGNGELPHPRDRGTHGRIQPDPAAHGGESAVDAPPRRQQPHPQQLQRHPRTLPTRPSGGGGSDPSSASLGANQEARDRDWSRALLGSDSTCQGRYRRGRSRTSPPATPSSPSNAGSGIGTTRTLPLPETIVETVDDTMTPTDTDAMSNPGPKMKPLKSSGKTGGTRAPLKRSWICRNMLFGVTLPTWT